MTRTSLLLVLVDLQGNCNQVASCGGKTRLVIFHLFWMCIPASPGFSTVITFLNYMNPGEGTIASCFCTTGFPLLTLTFLPSLWTISKGTIKYT